MDKKPFLRLEAGKIRDFVKKAKLKNCEKITFFRKFITKLTLRILPQPWTAVKRNAAAFRRNKG